MPKLIDMETGSEYPLDKSVVTLGRAYRDVAEENKNDINLPPLPKPQADWGPAERLSYRRLKGVSREHHVSLVNDTDDWKLESNPDYPVFLNGNPVVDDAKLIHGDMIMLGGGKYRLVFSCNGLDGLKGSQ